MRINRIVAEDVHGYLRLQVAFNSDLTFLTGLNGSGKTSVLRLLVALLTPVPEELISISFSSASVEVTEEGTPLNVWARKTSDGLELGINTVKEPLRLTSADLQLLLDRRREEQMRSRDDSWSPVLEKISVHPTYKAIREISTPMFLGLDRRFTGTARLSEEHLEVRRRELMHRRMLQQDDPSFRGVGIALALADVNFLVFERMQEIRAAQEKLDEDLRRRFFTRAFEYKPAGLHTPTEMPNRRELERLREELLPIIERAAEGLRLPAQELRDELSRFFERILAVASSLEAAASKSEPAAVASGPHYEVASKDYIEWIVNKPQADRILEHLLLLSDYADARTSLREPIDRFLTLINGFLEQTKKRVDVSAGGDLQIHLADGGKPRSITALSSGERQLLVMLGHLSLNPHLEHSGVFIVDEPELSLHIAWQERFVDAVARANPKVQLILATHSPAIILDRLEACRSLS